MQPHLMKVKVGEQELIFETGKIGKQANGAVLIKAGETYLFNSACAAANAADNIDFFPLKVDYQEKFSAVGKTISGFIKREGRPSEKETLISRLIDRPIRPMFPEGYYNEVQLLSYVWSYDGINMTEPLAICGISAALVLSDIPLLKPVAGVRVGLIDGKWLVNPTQEQMKKSKLDLMLAGTENAILMIEGHCDFLTEDQLMEAIEVGHNSIKIICQALHNWQKEIGKEKNLTTLKSLPKELMGEVEKLARPLLEPALRSNLKQDREEKLNAMRKAVVDNLLPEGEEPKYSVNQVNVALKDIQSKYMRKMILEEDIRSDGRDSKQIRSIDIEQGLLPRTHGSSLFTRGETQAVGVCTLGGEAMSQRYEDLDEESSRRFYLQYFFPPFSVGEVGRIGSPGRREIGHGKLAERALSAIVPARDIFPYTMRLESTITESNGSSSMATVCAGCLSMMDAGVPIKRPIAGIAMGLILEEGHYKILSDILGIEDALGDMDFKIAGDQHGITAFQMDIKVEGITPAIMQAALNQAKEGRIHILNKMLEVCPTFKPQMSIYAPRIETMQIKPSKIATVIGPGGKQIRAIIEASGVEIDINDDGLISIASTNLEGIEKAKAIIHGLTAEVEIGRTYTGKVTSVVAFGAFIEILPGKEGLCHISEFEHTRIENLADHVKQGEIISVKVLDINERGQLKLSRKALLSK
ncbi:MULTISPECIES: polyribonucleotide nucleotidyltransferase [unclassified Neochlamydia]|uniref:polyribonucleotide nucleotidyltransferase n=1 Tax=unclassified Neochlamydia TaxID=2643326 RepID=UPI001BCA483E|nr:MULTISPECIES: polyribonucleotide nucleotidyltransferase [unclassified Neochlamydia]MBS4166338.1 Polyribonucleotide nucleotidyltransferase [Neochlamydia sp. AcF65]MBS4171047.1 Polyribonucleotide nucleotidyltransferase [Neochlamydia sp. AcF95]